jgi:hypothetical protein
MVFDKVRGEDPEINITHEPHSSLEDAERVGARGSDIC